MMSKDIAGQQIDKQLAVFLQKVLQSNDSTIYSLAGDASTRRYYRVVLGSHSWVLMCWEPFNADKYPFLSVQSHFARHNIGVPKVIEICPEAGLTLLEDLGDLTLERKFWENQEQNAILPFYRLAIDELVKIHYPATMDHNQCTAFQVVFDKEKLLWEMNYGFEHFLQQLCKIKLTGPQKKQLDYIFGDICNLLANEPKLICHRDYHSRNLMITLGKMRVIDFQDARLGPMQYDLVSLIKDSYVDIDDASAKDLISYYLECRSEFKPSPIDKDHFFNIYEIQSIQRCFKACGSFASFFNLRQDTRYLKYIPRTLVRVVKSLIKFPKYQYFTDLIIENGLMERNYEHLSPN